MMRGLKAAALIALTVLPSPLQRATVPADSSSSPSSLRIVRGLVEPDTPLASILAPELSAAAVHALVEVAHPLYDLARVDPGRPFGLARTNNGLLLAFTYGIDDLRTLRVSRQDGSLESEIVERSYDVRPVLLTAQIDSSLFLAVARLGESGQLALDLAEIFAWDVDFHTEIQPGDSFRVALDKLYLDGAFRRYGRIDAAELNRGARTLRAVYFESSSGNGFYAPDGTPMRKAFLRSPLRFIRISSRFSNARRHPILKIVRPHHGVDYAAPRGTPVQAAADGRVVAAGRRGGYGKTVRLRHANGYETMYGHLSSFRVRSGQRVCQGDVIGRVGATGIATGPHLDYRMFKNGIAVDPLRVRLPPAPPIPLAERAAFQAARDRQLARLDQTYPPAGGQRAP
jgi:murein DD-endopeptidase MepM/ murein hydrolase activator NlpD